MSHDARFAALKLILPPMPTPMGTYATAVRTGNLLYTSGHGPQRADGSWVTGRLGADLNVAAGKEAARLTALALLATLRGHLGSLDKVTRVVKVLGIVQCTPEFGDQPAVVNGFSDLMVEVFGDAAMAARSAVGTNALPSGIAVEIEAIFELRGD